MKVLEITSHSPSKQTRMKMARRVRVVRRRTSRCQEIDEEARVHGPCHSSLINATHPNSIISLYILLDSASEAHFIKHAACNRLGVKRD